MLFRTSLRRAVIAAAVLAAVACGSDPVSPGSSGPTSIRLVSDSGDWVGEGRTYEYTNADAVITVNASGNLLTVTVDGDEWWRGHFQLPGSTSQLRTGTWEGLTRQLFNSTTTGGLSWSGEGRACNTLNGSVTIDAVTYEAGVLKTIDLRFVQHCEGGSAALRGTIHWRADDPTAILAPVTPIPSTLWQPPSGVTPATGDYVYLESDPGDPIAGGATSLFTEPSAPISIATATGRVNVAIAGWMGIFQAMTGLPQLQVGYYADVGQYPFHHARRGGMDWFSFDRVCSGLNGWFAVDAVTYSGSTITAIELRFEQRCNYASGALRGKIRWAQ